MSTNVKTSRPKKTISVPIRSRAKVPRRFMLGCSWEGGVLLPLADELDQDVDLGLAEDAGLVHHRARTRGRRSVGGVVVGDRAPVGHDAAVVLEAGEAVLDAPVVVVLVEVAQAVLVVEGRSSAALTQSAVAARAVLVVELRALGERVLRVDDEVLVCVRLIETETVAVVADDAADLVDPQLARGGAAGLPVVG